MGDQASLNSFFACITTPQICGSKGIENENSDGTVNLDFPQLVQDKINEMMPDTFTCKSKICDINTICELNQYVEQDVYAQAVAISATLENYSPRQLKMFCWNN